MSIYLKAAQSLHKQGKRNCNFSCVQVDCEASGLFSMIYTEPRRDYAKLFGFDGKNWRHGTKNEETLWAMGPTEQWELRMLLLCLAHEVLG